MTTPDNRAALEKVAAYLERLSEKLATPDDLNEADQLECEIRALLAAPEAVGVPSDGEICGFYAALFGLNSDALGPMPVKFARAVLARYGTAHPAPPPVGHPDDEAVDRFAAAMKAKLAKKREEGRSGWQTASADFLSQLLHEHLSKGDPVDIGNFAMMLHQNGQPLLSPAPVPVGERLPSLADCDDERGYCWMYDDEGRRWEWAGAHSLDPLDHTHWLPHWALPLPGVE